MKKLVLFAQPLEPIYGAGPMDIAILVTLLLDHWPQPGLGGS